MRASVEHLVCEVFQDVCKSFRTPGNTSEARSEWIQKHESAVEEIERLEKRIRDVEEKQLGRRKKIGEDENPEESTKPVKQSFASNLEPELAKKYALIQSRDLFPEINIDEDSVPTSEKARERWKKKQPAARESFASKPKTLERIKNNFPKFAKPKREGIILAPDNIVVGRKKPQRSIIRTEDHRTILVARPTRVEFVNFERRRIYKRVVVIRNVSNAVAKFQVETSSPRSNFSIALRSRTGDRENLAPGMEAKMIVAFGSEDSEDCEERFVVKVQFGKPIFVHARAYRDPPVLEVTSLGSKSGYSKARTFDNERNLSLIETCGSCENSLDDYWEYFDIVSSGTSDSNYVCAIKEPSPIRGSLSFAHFDCKKCFVGERTVVATRLRNTGGDGRFFVMSEIDWNSMSIDDITTKNLIVLTCFAVWPAYFSLKHDEEIELLTYFFPDSHGVQVDKLYVVCDNFAVHPVELIGDGLTYDRDFITIGKNVEESSWFEQRDEDTCEYIVDLGVATPNGYLKSTITVTNSSGMEIHYRWEKRSTNERETRNRFQSWKDFPLDCLSVRPTSGIFPPCSAMIFKITAGTTNLLGDLYRAVLQFIIEDIPNAAINGEYEERIETCRTQRRFCETSMDLRAKEIELWIRCDESLDFGTLTSSNSHDAVEHRSSELPAHKSISA